MRVCREHMALGVVDRHGEKCTICDTRGLCQVIRSMLRPVFHWFRCIHFVIRPEECRLLPEYITYISMEDMPYFDQCAACYSASYTSILHISWRYNLSSTRVKLSCLLKMTLHRATAHQRYRCLAHSFKCPSSKRAEQLFFAVAIKPKPLLRHIRLI